MEGLVGVEDRLGSQAWVAALAVAMSGDGVGWVMVLKLLRLQESLLDYFQSNQGANTS